MKTKLLFAIAALVYGSAAYAVTECRKKINTYFIGTDNLNGSIATLWVNFEGGGSASVYSTSAAFNGMLSTTITSITVDKFVTVRLLANNANCNVHNSDWVGVWL